MWRHYLIEVPKTCSVDAPVAECTWTCVDDIEKHVHAKSLLAFANITEENTEHFSEVAHEVFCDTTWWSVCTISPPPLFILSYLRFYN